jgi:hypothetical protein
MKETLASERKRLQVPDEDPASTRRAKKPPKKKKPKK